MHTFTRHGKAQHAHWLGSSVTLLLGLLLLSTNVAVASDEEPDIAAQTSAKRLAVGVCCTCNGPEGNSTQPK
jgi:hypothetical protein